MKQLIRYSFLASVTLLTQITAVTPLIMPRSQSEDSARELVGWTRYINLYDQECVYGSWAFTFEYSQTMRPQDIRQNLFGADLVNGPSPFIQISGSQSGDRNATDWLADYFGLPTDFKSQLIFDPKVQNIIFDIDFYLGLDEWQDGLYFRFHVPVVNSRWDLNFDEINIQEGVNGYDPGYFGPLAVPRSQLLPNFTSFATNKQVPTLGDSIIFNPLLKARIPNKRLELTRLAELQAAFGWNFLQSDDHHFGLNLRMAAPLGNRPEGVYLFEPLVGNGHHWELGLGLTGHVLLFVDECRPRTVGLYFDANITHLFATRQQRTFDLDEKPMSRYMLVERMSTTVENLFASPTQGSTTGALIPTAQFDNIYVPLANLSTFDVDVSIGAQVDATAMIDIAWGCWNIDFGYNFWARTCEKISPSCQCAIPFDSIDSTLSYALKGDARTYGFVAQDAVGLPAGITPGQPIALSATESLADIHSGTNTPIGTPYSPTQTQNPGIDLEPQQWAYVSLNDPSDQIVILPTDDGGPDTQQRTTLYPVLIEATDLAYESAETKGLSNRLFGNLSYNFDSCDCDWSKFIGIGGFVEFAHHQGSAHCSDPDFDDSCQTCAFSQWGIWIKGGFGF